tara:strand:+ start:6553 stop:6816 length:264 start_codon:yes stop_codon:yes gene_type:complete
MDIEDKTRRAELDLGHIAKLQDSIPFNDYFIRRLEEKRQALAKDILENDSIDTEKRESLRVVYQFVGELIDLPKTDKMAIRSSFKNL